VTVLQLGVNKSTSLGAQLHVVAASASTKGMIVQMAATPTANAVEIQDSAGAVLANVSSAGALRWGTTDAAVMLKPNGTQLQVRLAADGGDASLRVSGVTASGTSTMAQITFTGNIVANTNNSYDVGTGSSSFRSGYFGTSLGVGTTATVNSAALLQLDSTAKGFLPPRMTFAQMGAISTPPNSLTVFCTDCVENAAPAACASGGTGTQAQRRNGAWRCN
jgi:hypothetical protein